MARYRLLRIGVFDADNGRTVIPQSGGLWDEYVAWRKAGNEPDPYVPPAPHVETLAEAKIRKSKQIAHEGLERLRTRFPAVLNFHMLQLVREIILSIAPGSRALTTDMQWASDTYTAGKVALASVQTATTIQQVDAVTPVWPPL